MKPKHTRPVSVMKVNVVLILVMLVLVVWQVNRSSLQNNTESYRLLKIERHKLASLLGILKSNQSVVKETIAKPQSVESMTISLLESVKAAVVKDAMVLNQLTVAKSENQEPDALARALSVRFSLSVHRAMNLLLVFDAIRDVAQWRALEVRGCELAREQLDSDSAKPGLHATCSIDVYYYPSLLSLHSSNTY